MIPEVNTNTQNLIIRPKAEAFKYREGGTSSSIVSAFPNKVEFDAKEGYLMYFEGLKYPLLGILDPLALSAADRIKKNLKKDIRMLIHPPFLFATLIAAFLPMKKFTATWLRNFSEFVLMESKEFIWKEERYCRPVREFHRAIMAVASDEVAEWIADGLAMFLENDRPYRYEVQDIFGEIDKPNLIKHPIREICRLVNLFAKRNKARDWKGVSWIVGLVLFMRPGIKTLFQKILAEINIELVKMDAKDKYMSYLQDFYDFEGRTKAQRTEIHKTL